MFGLIIFYLVDLPNLAFLMAIARSKAHHDTLASNYNILIEIRDIAAISDVVGSNRKT
jgi:hypothetical protein